MIKSRHDSAVLPSFGELCLEVSFIPRMSVLFSRAVSKIPALHVIICHCTVTVYGKYREGKVGIQSVSAAESF